MVGTGNFGDGAGMRLQRLIIIVETDAGMAGVKGTGCGCTTNPSVLLFACSLVLLARRRRP
jgi:hypothetical protein